jgi:hypothetical protein
MPVLCFVALSWRPSAEVKHLLLLLLLYYACSFLLQVEGYLIAPEVYQIASIYVDGHVERYMRVWMCCRRGHDRDVLESAAPTSYAVKLAFGDVAQFLHVPESARVHANTVFGPLPIGEVPFLNETFHPLHGATVLCYIHFL